MSHKCAQTVRPMIPDQMFGDAVSGGRRIVNDIVPVGIAPVSSEPQGTRPDQSELPEDGEQQTDREDGELVVEGEAEGENPQREGVEGGRKLKVLGDPMLPTALEVERHCLTHVPYRSWCPHCVRGRGKEMNHDKKQKEHSALKEFAFDY